jgi:hypothetical protein
MGDRESSEQVVRVPVELLEHLNRSQSRWVLQRFGLKLLILVAASSTGIIPGLEDALQELNFLSSALCALLALQRREQPLSRRLNYWDEACGFGLLAYAV